MFKSATAYRIPTGYELMPDVSARVGLLAERPARDPGHLEMEATGFGALVGDVLTLGDGSSGLVVLETASRMLPADVVARAVHERLEAYQQKMGRRPGKRMRQEIRDLVLAELLPKAFVRIKRTHAFWDSVTRLLVVESVSDRGAEAVVGRLRDVVGTLPVRPLAGENAVELILTTWLRSGELPEGFEFGDGLLMIDPSDTASKLRASHMELDTDELRQHTAAGRTVTQLSLVFRGRIRFVLDTRFKLRSIRLLDLALEGAEEGEDPVANLDATFRILRAELAELYRALDQIFRFVED